MDSSTLYVISSRSLRSAQSRKRVPSLASPSLGHYAALSFIVRGRGQRTKFRIAYLRSRSQPFDPFDKLRTGRLRRAEARPVDSTG